MTEIPHYDDGAVESNDEGDVVVPDVPDALGWQREVMLFDHISDTARALVDGEAGDEAAVEIGEVKGKDLQERLFDIHERFHFYPGSHDELNDAIGLSGEDLIRGSATFLSKLQQRQVRLNKEATERNKDLPEEEQIEVDPNKPRQIVESVIGRYISYATTAKTQGGLLLGLTDMISARGAKRSEAANSVPVLRDWKADGSTYAPILSLLKADDTETCIAQDTLEEGAKSPLSIDYTKLSAAQLKEVGDKFIGAMKVGQLQDLLAQRVNEQRQRYAFWVKALEDSRVNNAAKDSAEAALKRFRGE